MSRTATAFRGKHDEIEVTFDVDDGSIECVRVYVEAYMDFVEIRLTGDGGLDTPFVKELQLWVNDQLPTYANDSEYDEPSDEQEIA